jgi:thiamine biosynthesis lipoprotein
MGTTVSIDVRDAVAPAALEEAFAWLRRVDERFSPFRPGSEVSRIDEDGRTPSAEMREILDLCFRLWTDSEGAFDSRAAGRFDPSGVVKGWAVEHAVAILERAGARNLCVNAGGDVVVRGERQPGRPWRVGIRHPTDPGRVASVLAGRGPLAVATSAAYERGGHVVDPRTGRRILRTGSVTVTGPDLALADGFATALWVDGAEGIHWFRRRLGYEALLLLDGRRRATPGMLALEVPASESEPAQRGVSSSGTNAGPCPGTMRASPGSASTRARCSCRSAGSGA